ncbi:hypothetical protein GHA01_23730 [Novacetimonas hansenii]|uniref:Uncharacterized protein n=1 Tax=Novacetimonas hansenii TaxID=436 RepID=A0ABQ0SGT8_NOVHA|nr:hypothetical protein Gaha_0163_002 [Novacetimonas hansenii JCM 7643]GEC64524.1 hypothetical protein GHA01_23730 [Novacetimonas hansenii]
MDKQAENYGIQNIKNENGPIVVKFQNEEGYQCRKIPACPIKIIPINDMECIFQVKWNGSAIIIGP